MRITNRYGETRIQTYQNGCKNSERILWMKEFLNTDSHASSPHEPSFSPMRIVDLGEHNVFSHFLRDRNCEICQRTKITRGLCRRRIGRVVPRAENFGDLITADHKVLSEGCESRNNHRYAVVVQDLTTQWIQSYPCRPKKILRKPKRACKTSWSRERSLKSFTLGNHCTHSSETNGIVVRAVRRVKEGIRSGWEMEGRFHGMQNLSAKHSRSLVWWEDSFRKAFWRTTWKDRSFRLVHWLSKESISLERKSYMEFSLDTLCTRGEFGRVT